MKIKENASALVDKLSTQRNTIFLIMCLLVHVSYFAVFLFMGAVPLCLVNAASSVFYILLLVFSKDREKSETATVCAYFEIIIFCTVCELFTRNTFGFIYFIVGLVPAIFYLCPSYGDRRVIIQIIGVVAALLVHQEGRMIPDDFFPELYAELLPYSRAFSFVNLLITMFTLLYASFFYKLELDVIRNELNNRSTHDPLTGLYNRRFLYDTVSGGGDDDISVILLDIDNFKVINDRFGHDKGDEILSRLSECLREENREGVFPVRWGGEEFVLYCKGMNEDDAYDCTVRLRGRIAERVHLPDGSPVTVTAGLASGKKTAFDAVVKRADDLLYLGKEGGKDCIVWERNEGRFRSRE